MHRTYKYDNHRNVVKNFTYVRLGSGILVNQFSGKTILANLPIVNTPTMIDFKLSISLLNKALGRNEQAGVMTE